MLRFHSITFRLLVISVVAFLAVAFSLSFSYLISVREIKAMMASYVCSAADAMQKNLEYIASVKPDAYKDENFKKSIYDMKLQYVEMLARSVEEVSSSIIEMTVAMKQVGTNVGSLLESAETTALSIVEMDSSIGQVEENPATTVSIVRAGAQQGLFRCRG